MHYINGAWVNKGSHGFSSINPATGAVLWQGMAAGRDEVDEAVAAARAAFPVWAATAVEHRLEILEKFKTIMMTEKEALAVAIAQETGKALWDARSEAAAVVAKLTYTKEAYIERTGVKTQVNPAGTAVTRHRPHGVMAVYGPYNFPAHLPNGHIMPGLLAGNTMVLKPSEQTPMVAEWIMKRWEAAGLPAGVLNLVQGEKETGIALANAPIDGVLFTGSTATGIALHKQFAGRPEIMLALEMGGNNPLIVTGVTDLSAAVYETILSAFTGTGQRCTCARRLMVDTSWSKHQQFIDLLIKTTKTLVVGSFDESPEPFMGPLISMREADRLMEAQASLQALGGKILLQMQRLREGVPFLSPGIIDMTGITNVPDEEYFGPLLQLYRAKSATEAVAMANQTRFGLSASIFCDDAALFQQLSEQVNSGLLNWNRQTTGASGAGPFGGLGISGNHRPAGYYAADYCAYPVASVQVEKLVLPEQLSPGIKVS